MGQYTIRSGNAVISAHPSKAEALRRAAILAKLHSAVFKVFGPNGGFVKSFDGR